MSKSGYLTKIKGGLKRNQRRWFVLKDDALTYYKDDSEKLKIAWMSVGSLTGVVQDKNGIHFTGAQVHFEKKGQGKHNHHFCLRGEDVEDELAWVKLLVKTRSTVTMLPPADLADISEPPPLPCRKESEAHRQSVRADRDAEVLTPEADTKEPEVHHHHHHHHHRDSKAVASPEAEAATAGGSPPGTQPEKKGGDEGGSDPAAGQATADEKQIGDKTGSDAGAGKATAGAGGAAPAPDSEGKHAPDVVSQLPPTAPPTGAAAARPTSLARPTSQALRSASFVLWHKYTTEGAEYMEACQFHALCEAHGYFLSREELASAWVALDRDESGRIEFDEFYDWWGRDDRFSFLRIGPEQLERVQTMSQYFNYFDADHNGELDAQEFQLLHRDLVKSGYKVKDVEACLKELDKDQSDTVSFNEFVLWMEKNTCPDADCDEEEEECCASPDAAAPTFAPKTASRLIFDKFDTNGDGCIQVGELRNLCFQYGYCLSEEELAKAMCVIDSDSSGTVDYDEFMKWWKTDDRFKVLILSDQEQMALKHVSAYFSSFDTDKNGELDAEEMAGLHKDLRANGYNVPDLDECMRRLDTDKNGTVDYNELVRWMVDIGAVKLDGRH